MPSRPIRKTQLYLGYKINKRFQLWRSSRCKKQVRIINSCWSQSL